MKFTDWYIKVKANSSSIVHGRRGLGVLTIKLTHKI